MIIHLYFINSKHKVRGLYGFWTEALFAIDIEQFDSFLKQQKKEAKYAAKNPQQHTTNAASAIDDIDPDEEVPDIDPSHEQLNLPPNSVTLWRIIPKLEYGSQVKIKNLI